MFFGRKKSKPEQTKDGVVSTEDVQPETGVDFHFATEQALKNVLLMSQQETFSLSLEKIAVILQQSFSKNDVQEFIKILARNQSK